VSADSVGSPRGCEQRYAGLPRAASETGLVGLWGRNAAVAVPTAAKVICQHVFESVSHDDVKQAVREAATIYPRPCKLTFNLLTLKVVSESRVTWTTSVPVLVLLGLSVLDLCPM